MTLLSKHQGPNLCKIFFKFCGLLKISEPDAAWPTYLVSIQKSDVICECSLIRYCTKHLIFSLFNLQSDIFNENHWTVFKNSKNWEYYSHLSISYLRAQKIRLHSARLAVWQISSFGRVQWKKVSWVSSLLSVKTRLFWKKRRKYQKKNSPKLIVLILNNFKYKIVIY